jgi:hypothetical protein
MYAVNRLQDVPAACSDAIADRNSNDPDYRFTLVRRASSHFAGPTTSATPMTGAAQVSHIACA